MSEPVTSHLETIQALLREREFARAACAAQAWRDQAPDEPDARYFLAVCCRAQGESKRAHTILGQLIEEHPAHSRGLQEYGHLFREQKCWQHALGMYRRATRENPSLIASWQGQEAACEALNDIAGLVQARQQRQWLQTLPKPLVVALDLLSRRRFIAAEKLLKRFMVANPRHVEGMQLLAQVAQQLGAYDDAALLLTTAHQLAPSDARLGVARVQLLRQRHETKAAYEAARELSEQFPDNPQYQSLAAIEAMSLGRYDEALARFDRVLLQLPNDPITMTSKGHALKTSGRTDHAISSYRAAVIANPSHGEAWYSLANLKTYRFSDEDISAMQGLASSLAVDAGSRVYLQFALGKAFEDREEWQRSFEHYAAGNAIKHRASLYQSDAMTAELAEQANQCDAELFSKARGVGCEARDPIFIVGLPRAGSTLLEQILSSHSQIDGTQELPNILSMAQRLRRNADDEGYPANLWSLSSEQRQALGKRYLEETQIHRQGAPFFIDKMPNNFRHVGLIKLILPNAKIIDARRHPMACCFSGFKQLFAEGQEFSYDLASLGCYYRDYVQLMRHWHSVLPGSILQVNNEEVISDLEGQVRRLLDFIGLPFETACLEYWRTERAIRTPSSEQVRRPVSGDGQHQWRHYAAWLDPLSASLGSALSQLSASVSPPPNQRPHADE